MKWEAESRVQLLCDFSYDGTGDFLFITHCRPCNCITTNPGRKNPPIREHHNPPAHFIVKSTNQCIWERNRQIERDRQTAGNMLKFTHFPKSKGKQMLKIIWRLSERWRVTVCLLFVHSTLTPFVLSGYIIFFKIVWISILNTCFLWLCVDLKLVLIC